MNARGAAAALRAAVRPVVSLPKRMRELLNEIDASRDLAVVVADRVQSRTDAIDNLTEDR